MLGEFFLIKLLDCFMLELDLFLDFCIVFDRSLEPNLENGVVVALHFLIVLLNSFVVALKDSLEMVQLADTIILCSLYFGPFDFFKIAGLSLFETLSLSNLFLAHHFVDDCLAFLEQAIYDLTFLSQQSINELHFTAKMLQHLLRSGESNIEDSSKGLNENIAWAAIEFLRSFSPFLVSNSELLVTTNVPLKGLLEAADHLEELSPNISAFLADFN
jgi:hypothetical protein